MNRQRRRAAGKAQGTPPRRASPADMPFASALALHKAGRLDKAEPLYRRALQLDPQHPDSLNFLGMLTLQSGRPQEAAILLDQALALAPDNPAVHYNLAAACQALGRHDPAAAHYRRVVQLQPSHQGAFNNLGLVLQELGRHQEAADALGAALALGADPRIHNNLGRLRLDDGDARRALFHFRQALQMAPGDAGAATGLANALLDSGDAPSALAQACAALSIEETGTSRAVFVAAVAAASPDALTGPGVRFLERALAGHWGRPRELARIAAAIVTARLHDSTSPCTLATDPLLTALLNTAPIVGRELEHALTLARQSLLRPSAGEAADPAALPFWCALAQQCFLNEYVFDTTPAELDHVAALSSCLSDMLDRGDAIPPLELVALAAYRSLARLPDPARLLELSWPAPLQALLATQVEAPLAERAIQPGIPVLTPISDPVSIGVRAQYEDNPYPRWTAPSPPAPATTIDAFLTRRFPGRHNSLPRHHPGPDILVAGCGTGQQSIEVARTFRNARVLAIDLSLASLAFARRKTDALGVEGVEYAQADLLRLDAANRRFDMIQASGVLHHLADPMTGWRALLRLLGPRGVMFIGLYSSTARRDVVAARAFIAEHGFDLSPDDIRRCRQAMIAAPDDTPLRRLSRSSDFASMSGCRDLLFHVQEHHFTLPEIAAFLDSSGLAFLGFDLPSAVTNAYRTRYPGDPKLTDLNDWDAFEQTNPDTFAGMYQFWVQGP